MTNAVGNAAMCRWKKPHFEGKKTLLEMQGHVVKTFTFEGGNATKKHLGAQA